MYLDLKKEERIAFVTLKHPPANSLSQAMIQELDEAFDELRNDQEVKVVILHGEGRFFAAGADIKEFTQANGEKTFRDMSRKGQITFRKIEAFTKPVIAAIHGAALGGGLELAMACHIRLVAEDAKLGLPELNLGLVPGFAGTQRLPRLVGKAKATEMLLISKPITGLEAVSLGLANDAYPQEILLQEATNLGQKIAQKGAISVACALELLDMSINEDFEVAQVRESHCFGKVSATQDAKEGIQAFIEKRPPHFRDK
ncbi:enoyl-CoA hydratase [Evansella vedderi]|nr:enoyl-CoA hydratase [Evansella vedderi]